MSIAEWVNIELKHSKTDQSDVIWGKKVIAAIDVDDCITLGNLMDKRYYPNCNINTQTNVRGYDGYMWTVSIHKFLGDTAIHYSLKQSKVYCFYMLLLLGADLTIPNAMNEIPQDMIKLIYNTTPENLKYDAKRKILTHIKISEFNRLPPLFHCSKVEEEAWHLLKNGRILYSEPPKIMKKKVMSERAHAPVSTRKHLSFNQNSKIAKLIQEHGEKFIPGGDLDALMEEYNEMEEGGHGEGKEHLDAKNSNFSNKDVLKPLPQPIVKKAKSEWMKKQTPDGYLYYVNKFTGESTWNKPPDYFTDSESDTKSKFSASRSKSKSSHTKLGEGSFIQGESMTNPSIEESIELYEDVWTKDNILDIIHLIEKQKRNFYSRILPPEVHTAQGLSLLNSVKLGNELEQTLMREKGILEQGRADLFVDAFLPATLLEAKQQQSGKSNNNADNSNKSNNNSPKSKKKVPLLNASYNSIPQQNLEIINKMKMFSFIQDMNYFQKLAKSIHDANVNDSENPNDTITQTNNSKIPYTKTTMNSALKIQPTLSDRVLFEKYFSESRKKQSQYIDNITSPEKAKLVRNQLDPFGPMYRVVPDNYNKYTSMKSLNSPSKKSSVGSPSKRNFSDDGSANPKDSTVDEEGSINTFNLDDNETNDENGDNQSMTKNALKENQQKIQHHAFFREITRFSTFTNMKYLNIGNNGAYLLSNVLHNDPIIVQLTLQAARIGDDGIIELASILPTMHRLKYLDLSSNAMTDIGAMALSDSLLQHKTLRVLSIAGNKIGLKGIVNVASAIVSSHIQLHERKKELQNEINQTANTIQSLINPISMDAINKESRIIWCSVKNNQLSNQDYETIIKLFEEYEFEYFFIRKTNSYIFQKKKQQLIQEYERIIPLDNPSEHDSQSPKESTSFLSPQLSQTSQLDHQPTNSAMETENHPNINQQGSRNDSQTLMDQGSQSIAHDDDDAENDPFPAGKGEEAFDKLDEMERKRSNQQEKDDIKRDEKKKNLNFTPYSSIESNSQSQSKIVSFADLKDSLQESSDEKLSPISRKKSNQLFGIEHTGSLNEIKEGNEDEEETVNEAHLLKGLEDIPDNLSEMTDLESLDKRSSLAFIL